MALRLAGEDLGVVRGDVAAAATLDETNQEFLKTLAALYGYDGTDLSRLLVESAANPNLRVTSYVGPDRWLNNTEATILASGARTVTTVSPAQTNYNARGILLFNDITAVPGGDTVNLRVQVKDPTSGTYKEVYADGNLSAVTFRMTAFYLGDLTSGSDLNNVVNRPIPRTWRVRIVHSGSGSFTYSVGAAYIL